MDNLLKHEEALKIVHETLDLYDLKRNMVSREANSSFSP